MLDPLSAFVFATLFALLNGAVLGFMHRALTPDVQPSAADWRIGTLLVAGGSVLFVGQSASGAAFVVPIANACWLMGLALYWRAMRRFFARPDNGWIFLPVVAGTAGNAYFVFVVPSVANRVAVATVCWVALILGAAVTMWRNRQHDRSVSATVLMGIFTGLAVLLLLRGLYYAVAGSVMVSIVQPLNWVNALTPLLIAVLPVIGTTAFVLLCFERIRRALHLTATTDALTALPNRLTINEKANSMFARARLSKHDFSVAVIDIDHFKKINDQYGHDAGDIVLKGVATILAAHCRDGQLVGRQGGEEFVALFDGADISGAAGASERLREQVEHSTHQVGAVFVHATVSIGVSTVQGDDQDFADVLRRADRALYEAKAEGRNRVKTSHSMG